MAIWGVNVLKWLSYSIYINIPFLCVPLFFTFFLFYLGFWNLLYNPLYIFPTALCGIDTHSVRGTR